MANLDAGFRVRNPAHHEPDLSSLSVSLADEFSGQVSAATVTAYVAQARERLLAAGVRDGLVAAVEAMARARLGQVAAGSTANSAVAPTPDQTALLSMPGQGPR